MALIDCKKSVFADDILPFLGSHLKLDRDKAVQRLEKVILDSTDVEKTGICQELIATLEKDGSHQTWESKHGVLMAIRCWLLATRSTTTDSANELVTKIKMLGLKLLDDGEVRVRQGAGEVLGALCVHSGPQIYLDCKDVVLNLIHENVERQVSVDDGSLGDQDKLVEKFSGLATFFYGH